MGPLFASGDWLQASARRLTPRVYRIRPCCRYSRQRNWPVVAPS